VCDNGLEVPMVATDHEVLSTIETGVLHPAVVDATIRKALDALRPSADTRDARCDVVTKALAKLDDELTRLAAAIAQGRDLGSLLQALKAREATRDQLRAELISLGQAPLVTAFDVRRLDRDVRARLTEWQGVLHRQTPQARQILQKLLVGRFAFTPGKDLEGRFYEFAGQGSLDKLLTGIIRPSSVVTPAGFARFRITVALATVYRGAA
jgi:hypothetical protein